MPVPELHFCSRLNHLEYMPTFICTRCPRWCQVRSRSNCSVADWTRCPSIPHSIVWPHFGYWAAHWDWKRHCEQSGGTKKGSSRQGEGVQEEGSQHIHIFINYYPHHYLGMLCTAKLINRCSVQSHPSTYSTSIWDVVFVRIVMMMMMKQNVALWGGANKVMSTYCCAGKTDLFGNRPRKLGCLSVSYIFGLLLTYSTYSLVHIWSVINSGPRSRTLYRAELKLTA